MTTPSNPSATYFLFNLSIPNHPEIGVCSTNFKWNDLEIRITKDGTLESTPEEMFCNYRKIINETIYRMPFEELIGKFYLLLRYLQVYSMKDLLK